MLCRHLGRASDTGRYNEYTCCFCCHVRMGTVFLGVFNLIKDLLAVTMIAAVSLHPELASDQASVLASYLGMAANTTESINQDINATTVEGTTSRNPWNCDDKFLGLVLTIGSSLLTVSLLYGTITARPKYILPYFWLQMFDFCIASLTVIGYFSYGPDTERWLLMHKTFPYRDELLSLGREWLLVLSALTAVLILWVKAYCISVVWSCYKFLIYRLSTAQHNVNSLTVSDLPVSIVDSNGLVIGLDHIRETEMILPPKYEDLPPLDSAHDHAVSADLPPPAYESIATETMGQSSIATGVDNPLMRRN